MQCHHGSAFLFPTYFHLSAHHQLSLHTASNHNRCTIQFNYHLYFNMAQTPNPIVTPFDAVPLDVTATTAEQPPSFCQDWTSPGYSGGRSYPIVDNRYYDGTTGQVRIYHPLDVMKPGPPSLDVYWGSRCSATGEEDEFRGAVKTSSLTVTQYVLGVGAFLKESNYQLHSLTATKYTIIIFISANMSRTEVHRLWLKYGL